jgi:predicted nuclease of predicted toxin-antitoxin system
MEKDLRIAVLIDADNVSDKYVKAIFNEVSNHGTPTYKRIYGDWTKPQFASWKTLLLDYSISPIQQYAYTTGKNATDAALIIDAMDILYSQNVDGFCIVSSDSDFTRLASRLREAGKYVLGMGEKKTPTAFIAACEKFKYLEVLLNPTDTSETADPKEKIEKKNGIKEKSGMASQKELIETIKTIINDNSDDDGWAFLGEIGNVLNKRYPDFDSRNYGYQKLTPLINSLKGFEVQSRKTSNPNITHKYVRIKQNVEHDE